MAAKNRSRAAAARRGEEATEWFSLLLEADLTPELRKQFERWSSDRRNRQAFQQLELLWAQLDHVRLELPGADDVVSLAATPAPHEDRLREHADTPLPSRATLSRFFWRRPRLAACAAGAFLSLATVAVFSVLHLGDPIQTHAGEWQHQRLADGSSVHIGPDSQLRIRLDAAKRAIRIEQGAALFEVAKDPDRPFVVDTPLGSVQAVGTTFTVSTLGGPLVVTVAEGKVTVSPKAGAAGGQAGPPITLNVGEQVSVGDGQPVRRRVNAQRELAWAEGERVDMSGEPIGEIAHELNRRNRLQIVVTDDSVAAMRPEVLLIRLDDPEFFIGLLDSLAPIVVVRDGPDRVRIEKAARTSPHLR